MNSFIETVHQLNMDVLIETHSYEELLFWLDNKSVLLGINNRNLKNMSVDINHSIQLMNQLEKNKNIICESGISSIEDMSFLIDNNFKTFLIGEFLMKFKEPNKLLKKIFDLKNEVITFNKKGLNRMIDISSKKSSKGRQ